MYLDSFPLPYPIYSFVKNGISASVARQSPVWLTIEPVRAVHKMQSCGQDSYPYGGYSRSAGSLCACAAGVARLNLLIVHFGTECLILCKPQGDYRRKPQVFVGNFRQPEAKMPERACKHLERDNLKGLGHGTNSNPF